MCLEKRHLETVIKLLEDRRKMNHPHILTVQSFFTKVDLSYGGLRCTSDQKIELFI